MKSSDLQENVIFLMNRIQIKKWYSKVTIVINDFKLNVIALIDSGADLSCIQEGLIPTGFTVNPKKCSDLPVVVRCTSTMS
jgi:hypothetical protein